jgi:two-component system CheB/CheR fusion protein
MELETLYNGAPIGLGMFSRDLRFVRINDRLAEINGLAATAHIGHTLTEVVPGVASQIVPQLERVIETGRAITGIEIRGETPSAPGVERVWLEAFYPVVMPDGEVEGVAAVVEEITDRKRHEEQLKLAMRELNHRVRNTLTVVLSIASQTVRYSDSLDDFSAAFTRRLRSLASAHSLLSKGNWQSTPMRELAAAALSPYCDPAEDTVRMDGKSMALMPAAALSMSMVLHELAANAAKYGALSVSGGRVDLSWCLEDDGTRLHVRWREVGGPRVAAPNRSGFGTRLIRHTMAHEFGGEAAFDYRPEGLICALTMPWGETCKAAAPPDTDGADRAADDPATAPPPAAS